MTPYTVVKAVIRGGFFEFVFFMQKYFTMIDLVFTRIESSANQCGFSASTVMIND